MNRSTIFLLLCSVILTYGCCITKPNCDPEGGNFKYGPELSYRIATFYGEDAKDDDIKSIGAIGFGGFVHWVFCEDYPQMGIYSGLFYSQYGGKYDWGSDEVSKHRIHYLTLPVTYTYNIYEGLNVEAGLDFSFLLAAKEKYEYMGSTETYNTKEDVANAQVGVNIALSYMHEASGFGGFFRFNRGLTKMPSSDYDYNAYNGGFSLGVRYILNPILSK